MLHTLSQIFKFIKRKLYCAFIDFTKAFDNVWRVGLWSKMLTYSVDGNFFNVVKNMYNNIKSCVTVNGLLSDYFTSFSGVRQGENLSPLLFAIYLNDLEAFLLGKNCNGVKLEIVDDQVEFYIKLLILLYADDTVLLASNPEELQTSLNHFNSYCKLWKLKVNISKTKIFIFGSGPSKTTKYTFTFGNECIQIANLFCYLGIQFHRNRPLVYAMKDLAHS